MPNPFILRGVSQAWSKEMGRTKRVLDLSCSAGNTTRMLSDNGFEVVATKYICSPFMDHHVSRVGGVDLNEFLPFKSGIFDGVNLTEVIEHIEDQPRLLREIGRVIKIGGVFVVSTPNVLNVLSRLRFLFTGFVRGRVRPVHYTRGPGQAPNIYLIHFYELYYLLFHYGFVVEELKTTQVKFAPVFFAIFLYPFMWLFSLEAVIHAEKDPHQRQINWQILKYFFSAPLLFSDNIVVKARKKTDDENRPGQ